MINIKPFQAIRPPRDKAYLVATRSYLSYTDAELDDKLNNNPFTFLHVINSSDLRNLPFGAKKYGMVKENFERFKRDMIFEEDSKENYYLYRQVKEGNEYIGLIAAVSVEDYFNDKIKKHENTLTNREQMFTDYLEMTGFNAEPVLLTYKDDLRLDVIFARYIEQRSEYEFTSTDKVLHQLWLIEDEKDIEKITQLVGDQKALYIADGHHRCASSSLLSKRLEENGNTSEQHQYFMAFLIGEEQMKVYDFNRLVKGLNGMKKSNFLKKIGENFLIEPKREETFKPEKIHEIGMYVDKEWYKLVPKTGSFNPGDTIDHLDTEILSKNILSPVFGVEDLKTDKRIGFLPGTEGSKGLEEKVNSGEYDVAFALFPVTVEQIKQVADENKIMPPKSTYIEPKLRSGLTVYNIK
jgi:uncharacterized protein (DUF1015 family)